MHHPKNTDTAPDARRAQIEALRRMGPEQRSRMAAEFSEHVLEITRQGIRDRHPEYTPDEVRLALAKIMLGEELFARAFEGKSPEDG